MDVSIVIVNFNTAEYTLDCLESIKEQTKEYAFEMIVIDNGSSDGSPCRIARRFPEVRIIRNETNRGLAAATTQGLKLSIGRYVISMNSDVLILDGAIDRLVRFLDKHPDAGGGTPKLLFQDGSPHWPPFADGITPWTEIMELFSELGGSLITYSSRHRPGEVDLDVSREVKCIVWGSCFIVRRGAMDEIGYQDPRFFIYAEDVDWSMRLSKAGWKLWYIPEAQVIHLGGRSANGMDPRMFCLRMESSLMLIQKHYGALAGLAVRETLVFVGIAGYAKWLLLSLFKKWRKAGSMRRRRFGAMIRAGMSPRIENERAHGHAD